MRTKKIYLILALLCAIVQGTWAQANWEEVYSLTGTTSSNWTALNAGSSTGKTIGTAGTTTYYYAAGSLTFTNSTAGGSGLTIKGTVYLYVPEGKTVTCTGANGNGQTGGGAGIELTSGNTLYLIGSGTVNATGGNAANGGNGGTGGDATGSNGDWTKTGAGGNGGNGGGGGAGGAQNKRSNSYGGVYDVTAYGGKGGKNADGMSAADGAEAPTTGTACNEGWVTVEGGSFGSDRNPASGAVTFGNGGSGGGCGNASTAGTIKRLLATDASGNYIIYNAADWDGLSALVAEGNTFNGKTVKLTVNISVSAMVGSSRTNSFRGTFDGQGHTLTFTIGTASDRYYDDYCAPFCYVNGATIQNLKVTGHIYYRGQFAGGLVAYSDGTTTISNCHVATVIHDNAIWTTGFDGGLVAWQYGPLSIMGCTFTGRLLSAKNSCLCGGFVCWSNGNAISITNSLYAPDTNIPLAADENDYVDGYTFVQADNPDIDNSYYTQTIRASKQGTQAYENGILYDGKYYVAPEAITLADTGTNDVEGIDGYFANVTLADRTLYKDGAWNTLCLPFDVTLAGSPLDGATARPLESASIEGTTLNLTFGDVVNTLMAGTPYIIKWDKADGYDEASEDTRDLKVPVFSGVTIDKTDRSYDNGQAGDKRVRFIGTYKSTEFDDADKSILFMGGSNTLSYPLSGASIGAQRAYFKIGEDGAQARRVTTFNINFGDESTGIIPISNESGRQAGADGWYTLDGRKLQGKPTHSGVYIYTCIYIMVIRQ